MKLIQAIFHIFFAASLQLSGAAAFGADIMKVEGQPCKIFISGPITSGDFQKIVALRDHLIAFDGESTGASLACLDSPGGSLVEGLKIARFFLEEGVGTRINAEKQCQSVCAVIFMMGNARGSEVSYINRSMNVTATLGFHRPYIKINDAQSFTSGDIEGAYDVGIDSIYDLMSLAIAPAPWGEGQMIEPDLMRIMVGTPGHAMFEIRTVEQALRWKIEIEGLPDLRAIGRPQIMFSCENALSSKMALTSVINGNGLMTSEIFELKAYNLWEIKSLSENVSPQRDDGRFSVMSPRGGYSSIGCEVALLKETIAICGFDESSDTQIGNCNNPDDMRYFSYLHSQHPSTDLRALSVVGDESSDAVTFQRCRVIDANGQTKDDEPCLHQVSLVSGETGLRLRHLIDWRSGARTVVEIGAAVEGGDPIASVNGQPAKLSTLEDGATCALNLKTQNTFCVGGNRPTL